jgi:acyl-CoA synthetase (AMP-forming)/AMP-acid ligase II
MVHLKPPSTFPVVEVPNCADYVESSPHINRNRVAYLDPVSGHSVTFKRMFQLADGFSKGILKEFPDLFNRTGPTDSKPLNVVITLFSPNVLLYPILVQGILKSNHLTSNTVIVSTCNAALTAFECSAQWEANTTSILLVHPTLLEKALEAWKMAKKDPKYVLMLADNGLIGGKTEEPTGHGFRTVGDVISAGLALPESTSKPANGHSNGTSPITLTPTTTSTEETHVPAFILFSSGTTSGKSKPIVISHRNVVAVLMNMTAAETVGEAPAVRSGEDVVLVRVPSDLEARL